MGESDCFRGKTVLLIGAGCAAGASLALSYSRAGARVILIDHAEPVILRIAQEDPARIDTLRLDALDRAARQRFARIWKDQPIDVLVHLQPLRFADRPADTIASIAELTKDLSSALRRGAGRVLIAYEDMIDTAPLRQRAFMPSLRGAIALLNKGLSGGEISVMGLELAQGAFVSNKPHFRSMSLWLTNPRGAPAGGSVMQLAAAGD